MKKLENGLTGVEPNPLEDFGAITMIGATSILGTTWFLLTLFLYPTQAGTPYPIPFIDIFASAFTWVKGAYISTWILYFFGSVIEFIFWVMYITDTIDGRLFSMWVSWVSTSFTCILYAIPPILATISIG